MGMNEVEVDRAALAAQADAIAAAEPVAPDAATVVEGAQAVQSWGPFIGQLFPTLQWLAIPQWNVPAEARNEITQSLGQIFDQLFPGGPLDGKWLPYVRLIAAGGAVVIANINQETGKLPPFGMKKLTDAKSTKAADTAAANTAPN